LILKDNILATKQGVDMKKNKALGFDEIMNLYDELFPDKKVVRIDPLVRSVTLYGHLSRQMSIKILYFGV